MNLGTKLKEKWQFVQRVGVWNSVRYKYGHAMNGRRGRAGATYTIRPKGYPYPLHLRYGTSDPYVFRQIFVEQEYAPFRASGEIRLIVDCGANVGFSSAYFLHRFPNARVIAVEVVERWPVWRRAQASRRHWSHEAGLVVCRYGEEGWRTQVRECQPGEASLRAGDGHSALFDCGGVMGQCESLLHWLMPSGFIAGNLCDNRCGQ